jgi:hypothetical protein
VEVDQELEDARKKAKALFPKFITVVPPGADPAYPAKRGEVTREDDRLLLAVWPQDFKDIHFDITEMEETDKGWMVRGAEGAYELRPREEI